MKIDSLTYELNVSGSSDFASQLSISDEQIISRHISSSALCTDIKCMVTMPEVNFVKIFIGVSLEWIRRHTILDQTANTVRGLSPIYNRPLHLHKIFRGAYKCERIIVSLVNSFAGASNLQRYGMGSIG